MTEDEAPPVSAEVKALARSVGHDFNNLLTSVLGAIDLAQLGLPPTSQAKARLDRAIVAAQRATFLARQLLALADSQRVPATTTAVDINEVLNRSRRLFEESIPAESVLTYELEPSLPSADVDPFDLQGLCLALVLNAGESLPDGQGLISIRTGTCETGDTRRIWFEVVDTGHGIDHETLDRILRPLFTTREGKRGLGLYYAHSVTEALNGEISVESSAEGSKVRVVLPEIVGETRFESIVP
ncbi:MAG: ATP-binding protein [Planctomycetota bacterium]